MSDEPKLWLDSSVVGLLDERAMDACLRRLLLLLYGRRAISAEDLKYVLEEEDKEITDVRRI